MMDIRLDLLGRLLSHRGDYLSGSFLAENLGVSRVSIKNHVDQLKKEGYDIEAVRNRGYCLVHEPELFHALGFQSSFRNLFPGFSIGAFDEIDSTNAEVDRMLNRGNEHPMIVVAGAQSKGKGRRGNQWFSDNIGNLYMSLGFRPDIQASRIGLFTLWVGIRLARCLRERFGSEVMVKWPNDLYVGGKKLAGILTEAKIDTDHVQHLIVGVGLNINGTVEAMPSELMDRATSLRQMAGAALPFPETSAEVAKCVYSAVMEYFEESKEVSIMRDWDKFDFLKGKRVVTKGLKHSVEGIASGIEKSGELKIKLDDGQFKLVHSGEVSLAFDR